ncbi:hypothetical protein K437DRAFT_158418 [Tilletiaria anomala UBC 951]|uniref:K Homology domain-containing protein n=1 Tax=Tilletiaria anomala (strain ATCC 24038 / CBS 436.72 / UBC 951) TaxID=1037660 RepID=A0A066VVL1_TILAU|nr:uncharacterized protein K437DRAFT_158418 [Tilletiaria anomala UBC 951]KDN42600.1 hypothetical protein K437DRAFT_158418 [Tilletiaria anomala UBC 951]
MSSEKGDNSQLSTEPQTCSDPSTAPSESTVQGMSSTPDTSRDVGNGSLSPKNASTPPRSSKDDAAAANNGNPPSSDPNASLSLRALVSTKEAGVIIGKGGSNVAELRDKTGVKAGVSKVVPGVHDRVLSVNGTIEGVAKAYSLIAQTILDNPVSSDPSTSAGAAAGSTAIRLLISHALMGTVIGKAGLTIKHIQDVSGARMVASKEMLPSSTERIVEVQGTPAAIKTAVAEISKCLLDDWERGQGTVLYHPEQAEGAGVLAATGAGGLQQQVPYGARGVGPRRTSGPAYLAQGMAGLSLAPGAPSMTMGRGPRGGAGGMTHPGGPVPAPLPGMAARAPPVVPPAPIRNGAATAAVPTTSGGVDLLANPSTAPFAAHIASLQHQSVFASTGIPACSATRPSAIADAAAQGAAVAPGGGLVAGGMTGAGPATAPAVVDAANMRTQNISIPSDMVGCIIGKGGSKITEIRRLSGSRISIAKVAHDETGERMFTIQGTPESNEKALFLLYNQLETEKERRTASGATIDTAGVA